MCTLYDTANPHENFRFVASEVQDMLQIGLDLRHTKTEADLACVLVEWLELTEECAPRLLYKLAVALNEECPKVFDADVIEWAKCQLQAEDSAMDSPTGHAS